MLGGYSLVKNTAFTSVLGRCSSACVKSRIAATSAYHRCSTLFRAHQQYRNIDGVTHLVRSRPVQNVADEPVPVGRHGNQVDIFLVGELNDFIRGLAQREYRITRKTFFSQFELSFFQIDP